MTITGKSEESPFGRVGTLGGDPELAFGASGTAYTKFSLAWSPYPNPTNETFWYTVTCFGTLAENVAQSLTKGSRVVVVGRGHLERWESKDGKTGVSREVLADGVGPDLRFATADVHRIARKPAQPPATDAPVTQGRDADGQLVAAAATTDPSSRGGMFPDEPF